mmetsp:Transcript_112808/g.258331  ORF Transcript_112808/g.258331 Transcript_112808/m.258331 type:complete len:147 (-) Transcript_112808:53-493(-)
MKELCQVYEELGDYDQALLRNFVNMIAHELRITPAGLDKRSGSSKRLTLAKGASFAAVQHKVATSSGRIAVDTRATTVSIALGGETWTTDRPADSTGTGDQAASGALRVTLDERHATTGGAGSSAGGADPAAGAGAGSGRPESVDL